MLAEALVARVLGEDARGRRPLPRRGACSARAYEPPFPLHRRRRVRRARATPSCPPTSSPPTTAPASSTPRSRSARTTSGSAQQQGLDVVNPVRLDGTYDERIGPLRRAAGSRTPTPTSSRTCARAAGCCAPRPTCTPTRTAGAAARRCSTTPSRPGTSARSTLRDRLLAANETIDWHPEHIKHGRFGQLAGEQRRLGAVARALLGHAAAGLALRGRATPTCIGSFAELEEHVGRARSRTRTGRSSTTSTCACAAVRRADAARARGHRRLVRLGLHAVRPVARAVRERGHVRGSSFPADYICEAIDQTRGWFYSLLAISTLLFDQRAVQDRASASATSPTPRARRCRSRWATSSCRGTSSTATAPTPSAGTS